MLRSLRDSACSAPRRADLRATPARGTRRARAYDLLILGDALIVNTIEFFTGSNPISARVELDGSHVALERDPSQPTTVHVTHLRRDGSTRAWVRDCVSAG